MISVHELPGVVAAVHADVVLLVEAVVVDRRHHELVHAVADLGVLERPVGAQPPVARRPRRAVVGRLEDAEALHDRPEAGRLVGVRQDRRQAEVARAAGWPGRSSASRPGWPSSVLSSDQVAPPSRLSNTPAASAPASSAPVGGGQARDLRQLEVAVSP